MKDGILTRQGATKLAIGMVRNGLNTYLIMVLLVQIPYYRARFDRLWVRLALRVITWGATILIIYFLVKAFWPTEFLNESSLIHITNHSEKTLQTISLPLVASALL